MPLRSPLLSALLCATALCAAVPGAAQAAAAAPYKADEVVVRYAGAHASAAGALPRTRVVKVAPGDTVADTARRLRARPGVLSATANYVAHASGWFPPDPGRDGVPSGWQALQWNFLPETGVNAPEAWQHLMAAGRPGGQGVTVAVVDTGVAYANRGRFKRSP